MYYLTIHQIYDVMKKFIYGALLIGCALFSVSCDDDEKGPALPVEVAYQNASGSYLEGTEQMALFRISLSSASSASYEPLVITLATGAVSDVNDLTIAAGTYSVVQSSTLTAGQIAQGAKAGNTPSGSYFGSGSAALLISTGQLTVVRSGSSYTLSGSFTLSDGSQVEVRYSGVIEIENLVPIPPQTISYQSAVGSYYGTDSELQIASYQIRFSTKGVMDENPPVEYLYLMLSGSPVTDLASLEIEAGTYTMAADGEFVAGKFYPGEIDGENLSGSIVMKLSDAQNQEISLVTGGEFTVEEKENKMFDVNGRLELQDGTELEFSYSGALVVDNLSSEGRPADELELPQSELAEDVTVTLLPTEGYLTFWPSFFYEYPDFDYVYIQLYSDNNYMNCIDLGLIVDKTKSDGETLPVGKYPMMNRYPSEFASLSKASVAAFAIKTDTNPMIRYGCWYVTNYATNNPLVDGEVEVLSFDAETNAIHLRFELKDNAETPHTVSGEFEGTLSQI